MQTGSTDRLPSCRRSRVEPSTTPPPSHLKDLTSQATQQQQRDDFNAYLDGFSPNVHDILEEFEFRNQLGRLSDWYVPDSIVNRQT